MMEEDESGELHPTGDTYWEWKEDKAVKLY